MSNSTMKKLALGLSAAAVIWSASADAQQVANLQVYTTYPFSDTAVELSYSFAATYCCTNFNYGIGIAVIGDEGDIATTLIGNGQPGTGPYGMDVAFFNTPELPEYIARRYPQLVIGRPFPVAVDALLLYSSSVDISAGLPAPLTTQIIIPDPSYEAFNNHLNFPSDNFGFAAAQILAQRPWRIDPSSIPNALVADGGAVGTTYSALRFGEYPYGIINRASACRADDNGNNQKYGGASHHVYEPFGRYPYNPELVTVTAVHVNRVRDAATTTAVNNLVAFLKGEKDSFGTAYQSGLNLIRSYCYKPPYDFWKSAFLDHH
jgi:molybdate transport system substrate-binding protein